MNVDGRMEPPVGTGDDEQGNAEKYSNVLKTDTLEFAQDIKEVNYSEIPVIDRDSAILLGNREMGSIPEYHQGWPSSSISKDFSPNM